MMNKPKKLPKNVKFATFDSEDENDMLLEIMIAHLINNGSSFNSLIRLADGIENEKDKKEMKEKVINTVLDFIKLNPSFIKVLEDNNSVSEYLSFLGIDYF